MRANADVFITFGQEDPLQSEAVCEHYLSKLPKPVALKLMNTYAYKDPDSEKSYGLMVDVTNRMRAHCYERRLLQVCFNTTPPFILGTPEYWGKEYHQRLQFIRDAYHGSERAGPDAYFEEHNDN